MTKRINPILIFAIVLLVPSLIFASASDKFGVAKATIKADNIIIVPIEISNSVELTALDIPLKFSEGVTLIEVDFEGTRVDYFDLKIANIDNENRTLLMGLFPVFSTSPKPNLAIGEGVIANLVFEITDPTIDKISLEAIEMKSPNHTLKFIYYEDGIHSPIMNIYPEFSETEVLFSNADGALPTAFALNQNYPNPFNPSTVIAYDLPQSSHVKIDIYNVLGQHVSNLIDMEMDAGSHQVVFDGSSYASGIYFYRISARDFSETKKMVMLK